MRKDVPARRSCEVEAELLMNNQRAFEASTSYVNQCPFGNSQNQRERLLADRYIAKKFRVVTLLVTGLGAESLESKPKTTDRHLVVRRDLNFLTACDLPVIDEYRVAPFPNKPLLTDAVPLYDKVQAAHFRVTSDGEVYTD